MSTEATEAPEATEATEAAVLSGILVVDKPTGMTSHDVVAKMRRAAGQRKIGHAGTLDPAATGVLVLGLGRATRLLGHLTGHDKGYDATIRLGASTVTDDAEGEIESRAPADLVDALTDDAITGALANFLGDIAQVPSSVSAVKIDGERSYARVRSGETVSIPARQVHVSSLDVIGAPRRVTINDASFVDIDVRADVSAGTYIRAIARDVGAALGVGGHLIALRRTRSGPFALTDAQDMAQLVEGGREAVLSSMLSVDDVLGRCFAVMSLSSEQAEDISHGRCLALADVSVAELPTAASEGGEPFALVGPGQRGLGLGVIANDQVRPTVVLAPG